MNKLNNLLTRLGLATIAESIEWAKPVLTGPHAKQVSKLAAAMDIVEYDTDHRVVAMRRKDPNKTIPGDLFAVEIYVQERRQARIFAEYVLAIDAAGNRSFRGTRLKPLTQKVLRRLLRDA